MKQTTTNSGAGIGYENDICHFCGKNEAGYAREENKKVYDACHKCAKSAKLKGDENATKVKN